MRDRRNALLIFIVLCALCVVALASFFYHAHRGSRARSEPLASMPEGHGGSPQILVRYTGVDENYGRLAIIDADAPDTPRFIENLSCDVVSFSAGSGVCLTADRGVFTTYAVELFDQNFNPRRKLPLQGAPSRARVSPDGKLAGYTVFLSGHGYAALDFSTQTSIIDIGTGEVLASLEGFAITRDGQPIKAPDFNFWGVTFTPDSREFFCTHSTAGCHFLVKGNIAERRAAVLHENVECPSASPDGSRVAYKKRFIIDGRIVWQLHILDLATMRETPLAEKRSVDDQLEWLNNDEVLYSVSDSPDPAASSATTNVWKAQANGAGTPSLFIPKTYSPAVIR